MDLGTLTTAHWPPLPHVVVQQYSDEEIVRFTQTATSFILSAVITRLRRAQTIVRAWLAGAPRTPFDLDLLIGEYGRAHNELTTMAEALRLPFWHCYGQPAALLRMKNGRTIQVRRFLLVIQELIPIINTVEATAEALGRVQNGEHTLTDFAFQEALHLNDKLVWFEFHYWNVHDATIASHFTP